jgi:FtsP/CotA-like multicopper oxidase with cupredoxin domain
MVRNRWIRAALVALAAVATSPLHARGDPLDPLTIPQFGRPLVIPPVMPAKGLKWDASVGKLVPYYEIEVVQFRQQVLPPLDKAGQPLDSTTVWSYGAVGRPETRHYPAHTVENLVGLPTRVKWVNGLVDESGKFLKHLLPVDQTLHWANPGQVACAHHEMADGMPMDHAECHEPYAGPVPIITHLHGAHVDPESDGFPEAWYLPAATDLDGYVTRGPRFGQMPGAADEAGAATFQYRNDQPATTLWFHDHTLGMTRANVYAGPAGFYLLRNPADVLLNLPGPAPLPGLDPNGNPLVRRLVREIPIVIQDRSFNADGSLFYPDNRDFFEGFAPGTLAGLGVDFSPTSDIAPIWNPEFFGDTIVVNGRTWPQLDVERRKYRFRLLNGSNSRFLILRFAGEALEFQQIGADQGYLPKPVTSTRLLLGPAERADVVVDFSDLPAGTQIVLENIGPDEPFGGGIPCVDDLVLGKSCDFPASNPETTGKVMAFDVKARVGPDVARVPASLPADPPIATRGTTRRLSLNELMSMTEVLCIDNESGEPVPPVNGGCPVETSTAEAFGPAAAQLGTLDENGLPVPHPFADAVTETPRLGRVETWEIYNFTADAHPIHVHLVRFNVVNRQDLELDENGETVAPPVLVRGTVTGPEPSEAGYKDTVIAYPGQVTRIRARFDIAGLYVWHCHILEHEDHDMMRPFRVVP